ncbi:hypothetical protein AB4Y45_35170 [Paraburkholderia sp. EG287A]|uniref:hypothetical protein n=1 Tax=Paraburkholderia sp. EG287A TaxID=3237012 RepID=UPI0034D301F7
MYANDLALGRSHYTADSATLVTFPDCARSELHWKDGALVYELFDTREEAIQNLNRLGFYPEPNTQNEEDLMNTELKEAIFYLKKANEDFAAGKLTSMQHAAAREAALIKGVTALAASMGVTLDPMFRIDARGELHIAAKKGNFGPEFSDALNAHCRARLGVATVPMADTSTWCYINHFDIEKLVLAFDK